MKLYRSFAMLAAALSLLLGQPAAADYVIKDGNGTTRTVHAFDCSGTICSGYVPMDLSGGAFGISSNPFYVILSGASTVAATQSGSWAVSLTGTSNVQAAQSGTWTVQPGNTANTTPWLVSAAQATAANLNATVVGTGTFAVQPGAATSGGLSTFFLQPAASDNHTNVKNGAGQVYKLTITNNSTTVNYLRFYDAGTGFNGCNSATNLKYQVAIPAAAASNSAGIIDSWSPGMSFSTGISICVTTGYATTDTSSATAAAMSLTIGYK